MSSRASISTIFAAALCLLVPAAFGQPVVATVATSAPAVFTPEAMLADLNRQLVERFQLRGELQLELARPWAAPAGVTGSVESVITDFPARIASTILVQVRLQASGRVFGSFPILLKAQLLRDVWASRIPMERGSSFDSTQLEIQHVDVLQQRDTVPVDSPETDFTYATSVAAGRPLVWRDLVRRSLVRKGQIIEVAAIDGTLIITTKALAMENGAAGDTVRLRNLESKKDFSALVVAEARAQVRF